MNEVQFLQSLSRKELKAYVVLASDLFLADPWNYESLRKDWFDRNAFGIDWPEYCDVLDWLSLFFEYQFAKWESEFFSTGKATRITRTRTVKAIYEFLHNG